MLKSEVGQKYDKENSIIYPNFLLIDLDRVLVNPALTMKRIFNAARACGVDDRKIAEIQQAYIVSETNRVSLDPLHLLTHLDQHAFDEAFLNDKTNILYPDSLPFMNMVFNNRLNFNIPTKAVNPHLQRLKLAAVGYSSYGVILDSAGKFNYYLQRVDENGYYKIDDDGRFRAKSLTALDDNPLAFYKGNQAVLPPECGGFLVVRDPSRLKDKDIPDGVEIVSSLSEFMVRNGRIVKRHRK